MIKIEMNKGHVNDCRLEGTAMEFTADLALIFQMMCETIIKGVPEKHQETVLEYFEQMCIDGMHKAKEFAKCTPEDKIKKVLDILSEAMKNSKATDSDDTKNDDFSTDFHNFLYDEKEDE